MWNRKDFLLFECVHEEQNSKGLLMSFLLCRRSIVMALRQGGGCSLSVSLPSQSAIWWPDRANRLSLPWPPTVLTSLLAFLPFLMRLTSTKFGFIHIMQTASHCPQLWAPECQIWGMLWHSGLAFIPPSHTDTLFTVTLRQDVLRKQNLDCSVTAHPMCKQTHICKHKYIHSHANARTHTHTHSPPSVNYSAGRILCQLLLGGRGEQKDRQRQKERK